MKHIIADRRALGVALVLMIGACQEQDVDKRDAREIRNAINKYFEENPAWRINEGMTFEEPTVIHAMAGLRTDLSIVTLDVYWAGKTEDARSIKIIDGSKSLGEFPLEIITAGRIDDPLVEEFTGHGIFNIPLGVWDDIGNGEVKFILTNGNDEYGNPLSFRKAPFLNKVSRFQRFE